MIPHDEIKELDAKMVADLPEILGEMSDIDKRVRELNNIKEGRMRFDKRIMSLYNEAFKHYVTNFVKGIGGGQFAMSKSVGLKIVKHDYDEHGDEIKQITYIKNLSDAEWVRKSNKEYSDNPFKTLNATLISKIPKELEGQDYRKRSAGVDTKQRMKEIFTHMVDIANRYDETEDEPGGYSSGELKRIQIKSDILSKFNTNYGVDTGGHDNHIKLVGDLHDTGRGETIGLNLENMPYIGLLAYTEKREEIKDRLKALEEEVHSEKSTNAKLYDEVKEFLAPDILMEVL